MPLTGAQIIARTLQQLGVKYVFGIVGIPVVEIADEAIAIGIKFIGFRNEQAAGYAASVYGYLTGRPGVCLVVGGPGVLHAMAGVGNSQANAFPMLLLAGSNETHLTSKGAFQELDAVALLTPSTKLSLRPLALESVPKDIRNAYRISFYGRPGTTFVDLPADIIKGVAEDDEDIPNASVVPLPPKIAADESRIKEIVGLLKGAKAPLVVVGKGAAYAQAESIIRNFIQKANLPFLPTPMGKGILPDSHPLNTAAARSTALKHADVALILGARLNWILHFGDAPKWNPATRFIQVDISPEEIGRNSGDASLGVVGDAGVVTEQLLTALNGWSWDPACSNYLNQLQETRMKNERTALKKAREHKIPMTYGQVFDVIKSTLHKHSPPEDGGIVYVSEGANTMDISRSVFPVEFPRLRLDAGTYATMGVGLGYAIAAHCAYSSSKIPSTPEARSESAGKKKIVAFEGDSAFGFSAMEVETMARYGMDILIFVINNGGIYHGGAGNLDWPSSTSLGREVGYEKLAEACGGLGFVVHTAEGLERATEEGFKAKVPVVVNVIIEEGEPQKVAFGWQANSSKQKKARL